VRIGSDFSFQVTPAGSIDEVRVWNVARTTAQIRAALNVPITAPQPGLVAVWALPSGNDVVGSHDGVVHGTGLTAGIFPVAITCGASTVNALCLQGRFAITIRDRVGAPGTAESAPHLPMLLPKMVATTVVSSVIFAIIYVIFANHLITLDQIPFLPRYETIR
jgi:predicted secreted protein